MTDFGKVIKNLRAEKGISQDELGKRICSGSEISKIENGIREPGFHLQCTLLNRLIVTPGCYTNYIYKEEYDNYRYRESVIDAICLGNYNEAIRMLNQCDGR